MTNIETFTSGFMSSMKSYDLFPTPRRDEYLTPYVSPMESFFLIRFDFVICRTCALFKRQNHMYTCSDNPVYLSLVPQAHSPASCR